MMTQRVRTSLMTGAVTVMTMVAMNGASAQAFNNGFIGNCSGTVGAITSGSASCGVSGANGVVTTSGLAGSTQYGWVSTRGASVNSQAYLPGVTGSGAPTNGAFWSYSFTTLNPDEVVSFRFNYITSDGNGYEDYAYGMLDNELLFTARSDPSAYAVPGANMPAPVYTGAPTGPIKANQTTWDALGNWSNTCWAVGCGFSDWLTAQYVIASPGTYTLKFGVVNLNDQYWDSGLAFDFNFLTAAAPPPPGNPTLPPTGTVSGGCEVEFEEIEFPETGLGGGKQKQKQKQKQKGKTLITSGSCAGDDALGFDNSYNGELATISQDLPTNVVPEPSTYVLLAAGLLGVLAAGRQSRGPNRQPPSQR
jgi:PEP-CTERM motif